MAADGNEGAKPWQDVAELIEDVGWHAPNTRRCAVKDWLYCVRTKTDVVSALAIAAPREKISQEGSAGGHDGSEAGTRRTNGKKRNPSRNPRMRTVRGAKLNAILRAPGCRSYVVELDQLRLGTSLSRPHLHFQGQEDSSASEDALQTERQCRVQFEHYGAVLS